MVTPPRNAARLSSNTNSTTAAEQPPTVLSRDISRLRNEVARLKDQLRSAQQECK